jgi:hypothetical protein
MAEPDNRSEDSKASSDDGASLKNAQVGPSRLSLTLLIALVIVVTAVVSVFRNEVISTIRKSSANLFPFCNIVQQPGDSVAGKAELKPEPAVSVITPSSPGANIEPDQPNRLALSSEDPDKNVPNLGQAVALPTQDESSRKENLSPSVPASSSPDPVNQNVVVPGSESQKDNKGFGSSSEVKSASDQTASVTSTVESANRPSKGKALSQGGNSQLSEPANSASGGVTPTSREKTDKSTISEEFQLPGSIRVKIQNYSGIPTRWALMILLDNSESMSRESKQWSPARIKLAKDAISKVIETIGPASKITMKDFSCKGNSSKDKTPCPAHSLFEWTEYPFKGLKEKVNGVGPGRPGNPCGAVLQSIKKDFNGVERNVPRLLFITCGQSKCPPKEIRRALSRQIPGAKVIVDVLALGIPLKRVPTYSMFAKKTGGLFLAVENPAQLEAALVRYKKALKVFTLEKIEIRNDKATVTVPPDEEIALVPGSYAVILPKIKGIADSHRAISNVKIKSGHVTMIEVSPKKGRASVRILDKHRSTP